MPTSEDAASKTRSKVWRVLNSPFGIWCLSSLILASITTGWTLFHSWLVEQKEYRHKRIALANEIEIRATDFLEDCKKSLSRDELWWHFYQLFQQSEGHLTQFSAASMDELVFQYRLLAARADQEVANNLTDASDAVYTLLSRGTDFDCMKNRLREIVSHQIIDAVKKDAETNGAETVKTARPQIDESAKNPCE
jgi:hypothetical protein